MAARSDALRRDLVRLVLCVPSMDPESQDTSHEKLVRLAQALVRQEWAASKQLSSIAIFLTSRNRITGTELKRPSVFVLKLQGRVGREEQVADVAIRVGALAMVRVLADAGHRRVCLFLDTPTGSKEWTAPVRGTGVGDFTRVPVGSSRESWAVAWTKTEPRLGRRTISGVHRAADHALPADPGSKTG